MLLGGSNDELRIVNDEKNLLHGHSIVLYCKCYNAHLSHRMTGDPAHQLSDYDVISASSATPPLDICRLKIILTLNINSCH